MRIPQKNVEQQPAEKWPQRTRKNCLAHFNHDSNLARPSGGADMRDCRNFNRLEEVSKPVKCSEQTS
jgi:hypothetical protein